MPHILASCGVLTYCQEKNLKNRLLFTIVVYRLPFTVYQLLFKIDVKVMVKKMFFMFFFHPV